MISEHSPPADAPHYGAVLLAFVLAVIHVYLGLLVEPPGSVASIRFLVIGAVFLVGVGVYLTTYFRPVLYLVGSLYAVFLAFLWLFSGMEYLALGTLTSVVGTGFVLLTAYLFAREEGFVN